MPLLLLFLLLLQGTLYAAQPQFTQEERTWIAKHPRISVGSGDSWAPFNYLDAQGKLIGITKSYLELIEQRSGLKIDLHTGAWSAIYERFKQGGLDLLPAALYSKEREAYGDYLPPHIKLRDFIFVRADNTHIRSFDDLHGKTLARIEGYAVLDPYLPHLKEVKILEVNNTLELISAVYNAQADAFLESQATIAHLLRENRITGLKSISQSVSAPTTAHFLVRKNSPMLYGILKKTLESIDEEERETIYRQWVDLEYVTEPQPSRPALSFKGLFTLEEALTVILLFSALAALLTLFLGRWGIMEMRLKTFNVLIIVFEVAAMLFMAYLLIRLDRSERAMADALKEKMQMLEAIQMLRQRSTDLTHFIRSYTVTGDERFLRQYETIVKIGEGELPRPIGYEAIYWDLDPTLRSLRHPDGAPKSFDTIIDALPFSDHERAQIIEARDQAETLSFKEMQAIILMRQGARQEAIDLLHHQEYYGAKHQIMLPLDRLITMLKERTASQIEALEMEVQANFHQLLALVLAFLTANGVIYYLLRTKVSQPISYLTQTIEALRLNRTPAIKRTFHRDEIGMMIDQFFEMHKTIQNRTAQLEQSQKETETLNQRIRDSIDYAALIQHALIPDFDTVHHFFESHFAIWHPKDTVGGDIYLFHELSPDEALLMVIDCTGHGVAGAFVTILVKAVERQLMANLHRDEAISPAKMLGLFNRSIRHLLRQDRDDAISNAGFEGGILYINKKERRIRYAGANTPLFYLHEGEIALFKSDRHSIGYKNSDPTYHFSDFEYCYNEMFVFYITTDGYLDQSGGPKGFSFGKRRFMELLRTHHGEPFADQQEYLLDALHTYQGANIRNDDITVFGARITGVSP
ncbi:MAG: transporter substrate-binding domain-containing protein [Campylobacterales bacterium]|nr:transporter substrate-binding domain-containing protein [Campylobacterales bacterium]